MWNEALSCAGHCVFGLGSYPSMHAGKKNWYTIAEKEALDAVHFDKIDASDAVLFLNMFAYLGESSLNEFKHACQKQKAIFFLESWGRGLGIGENHKQTYKDACARFNVPWGASPIATSEFRGVWSPALLGDSSNRRSNIVRRLRQRESEALGFERE